MGSTDIYSLDRQTDQWVMGPLQSHLNSNAIPFKWMKFEWVDVAVVVLDEPLQLQEYSIYH